LVVPGEKLCKQHLESDMELMTTTSAAVDAIEIEALQLNVGADAATTADGVDRKGSSDRGGSVGSAESNVCVDRLARRIETEAVPAGGGGSIHKVAVLDLVRKKSPSHAAKIMFASVVLLNMQGGGELCALEARSTSTIAELKERIQQQTGLEAELSQLQLTDADHPLRDKDTLQSLKLPREVQFYLVTEQRLIVAERARINPAAVTNEILSEICEEEHPGLLSLAGCVQVTDITCLVQQSQVHVLILSGCAGISAEQVAGCIGAMGGLEVRTLSTRGGSVFNSCLQCLICSHIHAQITYPYIIGPGCVFLLAFRRGCQAGCRCFDVNGTWCSEPRRGRDIDCEKGWVEEGDGDLGVDNVKGENCMLCGGSRG
jgi:hypothetical protein